MSKKNTLGIANLLQATNVRASNLIASEFIIKNRPVVTVTNIAGVTYTTAQLRTGWIVRDTLAHAGSISDSFPTTALLISDLGLAVGDSFDVQLDVYNTASAASVFIGAGSGGTFMTNSSSVTTGVKSMNIYRFTITSSTTHNVYRIATVSLA
jgi:hypothetical protein